MYDRRAAVVANRVLSPRHFLLELHCRDIPQAAQPGQFVMVAAGAALDPLLRRPMAISQLCHAQERPVGFTLVIERRGRGTTLLSEARPGDTVRVLGPLGQPFRLPSGEDGREHVLVMGGVGAAPFPWVGERLREAGCRVRAFVGAGTKAELLCLPELESAGLVPVLATEDGSAGHRGLVTEPLAQYLRTGLSAAIYTCGPMPMMAAVEQLVRPLGLPHQVSLEATMACGIGVCLSCVVPVGKERCWRYRRVCREGPVFDAAELVWGMIGS